MFLLHKMFKFDMTILTFLMMVILTNDTPYGRIDGQLPFCRCLALVPD